MEQMSTAARLHGRRIPTRALRQNEFNLRELELERPQALSSSEAKHILEISAKTLELTLIFAAYCDAVKRLGLVTLADVLGEIEAVDALVKSLSHLDPVAVARENASTLETDSLRPLELSEPASIEMSQAVKVVETLLLNCPIGALEKTGHDHTQPQLAHRCRVAFDGLCAFVKRNTHPRHEAIAAAGHTYAEGRASIDEVSAMLDLPVPDVVALLEAHGYHRSVDRLRLTDDARAERLRRIREDRLARGGGASTSDEMVRRDVVATQRIEGVDARAWLRS